MKYKTILFPLLVFISVITIVSAFPYQLNLSSGILIDLNASNNATTNFTIYIIPPNISYATNLSYTNCNVSYNNYTNYTYTYIINGTNRTFYTANETDAKFLSIIDFNAYKAPLVYPYAAISDFNALASKVSDLNQTVVDNKNGSHIGIMWSMIAVSFVLSFIGIFMAYRVGSAQ